MSDVIRVLHVSPEAAPFSKTGGLGDVSAALPRALSAIGCDVQVLTPLYAGVKGVAQNSSDATKTRITLAGNAYDIEFIPYVTEDAPPITFVKCDKLFGRDGIYVDNGTNQDFSDNDVRFLVLCRAALELCKRQCWFPDILHGHDWQAGPVAYLLRHSAYAADFADSRSVFTIHNMAFQGLFPRSTLDLFPDGERFFSLGGALEYHGLVSYLKTALEFSDAVNTVSPTYAQEVQSSHDFGFGLENVLAHGSDRFSGIMNGIDTHVWNPETDSCISVNYGSTSVAKKRENKKTLCRKLDLPYDRNVPLLGMISRMTDQKGFEIIIPIITEIIDLPAQLVILGTGDAYYEHVMLDFARLFRDRIHVTIAYDETFAHQIEAGADMFLMPSRFEPSGLNQMMSMRYGTLPIVRATGGLADTVVDADSSPDAGTGFSFTEYSSEELLATVNRAMLAYHDHARWRKLQRNAMSRDYSWEESARRYLDLYRRTLERPAWHPNR